MTRAAANLPANELYEEDFYAWTQEQARLLRERRFADLDIDHLIDEVVSVGASEKREIENRLEVLISHLLKWKFQPGGRCSSWRGTIEEQRSRLRRLLTDSPSLQNYPIMVFGECYLSGRLRAARESGIDFTVFPEAHCFAAEQALDAAYWPTEPDLLRP